jgi:hypothetical protein
MSPAAVTPMPLLDGGSQTINGLANGTTCNITEGPPPPPVITAVACTQPGYVPVWSTTLPPPVNINGADATATVQNFLDCKPSSGGQLGELVVTKTVLNKTQGQVSTAGLIYPFSVSCSSGGSPAMVTTFNITENSSYTVSNIPLNSSCSITEPTMPTPTGACATVGAVPTWQTPPTITPASPVPVNGTSVPVTVLNTLECKSDGGGTGNGYVLVNKFIDNQTNDKSGPFNAALDALVFPVTITCNGNDTALNVKRTNTEVVHAIPFGQQCNVAEGTLPPPPSSSTACGQGMAPAWGAPEYTSTPAGLPVTVNSGAGPAIHVKNPLICAQAMPAPCKPPMIPGNAPGQCVCPQGMLQTGNGCVPVVPPPACRPPMVPGAMLGQCVCPAGTVQEGSECVKRTVCKAPMVPGAAPGQCVCPGGTKQQGNRCVETVVCRSPAKLNSRGTACTCPQGMTLKGNTCVENERKRPAVTPNDVIRVVPGLIGPGGLGGGGGGSRGGGDKGGGGNGGAGGGGGYKPPGVR